MQFSASVKKGLWHKMAGKGFPYKLEKAGDSLNVITEQGLYCGGKVMSFKFSPDCEVVKVNLGGSMIRLYYACYVGPLSLGEWKAFISCTTEELNPTKEFIDTQCYTDNSEQVPECDKNPVWIDRWFDGVTWCYVLSGQVPLEDGTNLLDINNYTMKGDFSLGNVKVNDPVCVCALVQYTAPEGGGAVAKDRATILADITAKLGITAPAGTAWDLQTAKVAVYSKGTDVTDFTSQVETTTSQNEDVDVTCGGIATTVNVNGGQIPFGNDPLDLDCDGESDNVLPADFALTIEEGSAVAVYACVTPITL